VQRQNVFIYFYTAWHGHRKEGAGVALDLWILKFDVFL